MSVGQLAKLPLYQQLDALDAILGECTRLVSLGETSLLPTQLGQCRAYAQAIRSTTGAFSPPGSAEAAAAVAATGTNAGPAEAADKPADVADKKEAAVPPPHDPDADAEAPTARHRPLRGR